MKQHHDIGAKNANMESVMRGTLWTGVPSALGIMRDNKGMDTTVSKLANQSEA
jgi:hypothetical protein